MEFPFKTNYHWSLVLCNKSASSYSSMSCNVFVDKEPCGDQQDAATETEDKWLRESWDVSREVVLMKVDADMTGFALTKHALNLHRCSWRCSCDIQNHSSSGIEKNQHRGFNRDTPYPITAFSTSHCCCCTRCLTMLLNFPAGAFCTQAIAWGEHWWTHYHLYKTPLGDS